MTIFSKVFMAVCRCPLFLISYISATWQLRRQARELRVAYGAQAACIAQEMAADYAQAGALSDALFWLQMAQRLKRATV